MNNQWEFSEYNGTISVSDSTDSIYIAIDSDHEVRGPDGWNFVLKSFDNFVYLPKDKAIELANFILEHTREK